MLERKTTYFVSLIFASPRPRHRVLLRWISDEKTLSVEAVEAVIAAAAVTDAAAPAPAPVADLVGWKCPWWKM